MAIVLVVLALVVLNGFFAMAEIAVVSARKPRLHQMAKAGKRQAAQVLELQDNPETMLSVVQIGITLVSIVAGAYGGAEIAAELAPVLAQVSWVRPWATQIAFTLTIVALTYLTLVIGELVPKAIGLRYPEAVAVRAAPLMRQINRFARPAVRFFEGSTRWVLRLCRLQKPAGQRITEDEVRFMIDQGAAQGALAERENALIRNVFRLGDREARTIMTGRSDIVWLDAAAPPGEALDQIVSGVFTRYPVCNGSLEKILGILDVKDYWRAGREAGETPDLAALVSPPVYVPENQAAIDTLETLREKRVHLAVVLDEYGATQGIVTLHDLVENIFGWMPNMESDSEPAVFERADGSLLVDGAAPFDELAERLGIELPPEPSRHFSTLAGFVMVELKRVPATGDWFDCAGFRFEIVDMDGPRVDKVLVRKA